MRRRYYDVELICKICNKTYRSSGGLYHHIGVEHKTDRVEYKKKFLKDDFNYECKICGDIFINIKSLRDHIWNSHNINKKEYYDKFFKKEDEGICKICGKETRFYGEKRKYATYCSKICSLSDPDIKLKRSKSISESLNKKDVKEKKRKYLLEYYEKHPEKKIERRERLLLSRRNLGGNLSKVQKNLYELVLKLFPDAVMEVRCLNYSMDIMIPSLNIVIEYDGYYWHIGKEEYDKKRQIDIENCGFKVIRYKGLYRKDILPTEEQIIKDISEKLLCQ